MVRKIDDSVIQELRLKLFPAIGLEVITGYDIFEHGEFPKAPHIAYAHKELEEGKRHRRRLEEVLEEDININAMVCCKLLNRSAAYSLEEGWMADEYFTIDAKSLQREEAIKYLKAGRIVIGVDKQYELVIPIRRNKPDTLVETLRSRVNRFQVNKQTGEYVLDSDKHKKLNRCRIWHAWEVPLIKICGIGGNLSGHSPAYKVQLTDYDREVSFVVGDKFPVASRLLERFGEPAITQRIQVNRSMLDWLNKTKNPLRYNKYVKQILI